MVAQADEFYDGEFETKINYEIVSHTCAQSVIEARMNKGFTQNQLAQKIGVKNSVVVGIENASGRYEPNIINNIEKVLGSKIQRGRKKGKK